MTLVELTIVAYHKKKYHRLPESTEIVIIIQASVTVDVHKKRHTKNSEYEHDEKQ